MYRSTPLQVVKVMTMLVKVNLEVTVKPVKLVRLYHGLRSRVTSSWVLT